MQFMNPWESRWQEGRIGFHLPEVNPYLIRHYGEFLKKSPENVFVPLCGKTLDLTWLANRAKKVVGVELVKLLNLEMRLQHLFKKKAKS